MMQNENYMKEQNGKIAVVLDTRNLVLRCQQLEQELETEKRSVAELQEQQTQWVSASDGMDRWAELGRREMERQKNEIRTRLQAIVHFTGDRERMQSLERMLSQKELDPQVVASLHRTISDEFRVLYPTQPLSRPSEEEIPIVAQSQDWTGFRIRSNQSNQAKNGN